MDPGLNLDQTAEAVVKARVEAETPAGTEADAGADVSEDASTRVQSIFLPSHFSGSTFCLGVVHKSKKGHCTPVRATFPPSWACSVVSRPPGVVVCVPDASLRVSMFPCLSRANVAIALLLPNHQPKRSSTTSHLPLQATDQPLPSHHRTSAFPDSTLQKSFAVHTRCAASDTVL
jgi:hypothetical protein